MNQSGEAVTLICQAINCQLFRLINNQRFKVGEGQLNLCWLNSAKVYFFSLEAFCQNLHPSTPLVTITNERGLTILFPHIQEGLVGIFIPGEQGIIFCQHLSQIIQIIPYQNAIAIPQFKTSVMLHCADIEKNPLDSDLQAVGYIKQGGEAAKSGFMWLGDKMASGINITGQYINSKIDKQEQVQVSQETKIKLAVAKESVAQGATMTGQYLAQLFKPVGEKIQEVKRDINNHIDQSNNQSILSLFIIIIALKDGRQITVASWDATGNAFSGLGTALSQVGDATGNNTRQCVEKRYGADVKNTYMGNGNQQK